MPATLSAIGGRGKAGPPGIRTVNIGGLSYITFGAYRENSTGNPAAPCLGLKYPASFRFRIALIPGDYQIGILCKQAVNLSPRPQLIIRKNTDMGINADVTADAPAGSDWVQILTATITVTAIGATYADLVCNTTAENAAACLFDHLTVTTV